MKRLIVNTLQNPHVTNDFTVTPSNSEWSLVIAVKATLSASSVSSSRFVTWNISDNDGNVVYRKALSSSIAANTVGTFNVSQCLTADYANGGLPTGVGDVVLPHFWLPPKWSIGTNTVGLSTGDQWSSIIATYYVTETQEETLAIAEALGISDI